ncbi:speckle-type poz protein [Anaeramoeba flamelloides]|uniref:Speckle-type poz protein n=1 Tax=Anaeramoeba flamelloides TaxID=1746091 RepID=A0AAV8AFM0_9EUKA|nr:speckle-type poz protein [Anaeramoeba flamelloides]
METLSEKKFQELLLKKYQQCPNCKQHNQINSLGAGFRSCDACGAIYCFYCLKQFETQFSAFQHFLCSHQNRLSEGFVIKNKEKFLVRNYNIFVKGSPNTSEVFTLRACFDDTVLETLWRIHWLNNSVIKKHKFIFAGKYLERDRIFCHYSIQRESTVYLVERNTNKQEIRVTTLNDKNRKIIPMWNRSSIKSKSPPKYKDYIAFSIDLPQTNENENENENDPMNYKECFLSFQKQIKTISEIPTEHQVFFANGKRIVLNRVVEFVQFLNDPEQYLNLNVIHFNDFHKLSLFSSFSIDFLKLFKSQVDGDAKIGEFLVHKCLVEKRLSRSLEEIQNTLFNKKTFNNKQIYHFLKWIYSDKLNHLSSILPILKEFKIRDPKEMDYTLAFKQLYEDEDSKDFFIKVNDGEDEDENQVQTIKVHRFILWARCGVYKTMFQNLNEKEKNINSIQDFSKKSIESLEILIKYLYTNRIQFTGDNDPELVCEELHDVQEYYQLNENTHFRYLLSYALSIFK